jgi:hypothetical protein
MPTTDIRCSGHDPERMLLTSRGGIVTLDTNAIRKADNADLMRVLDVLADIAGAVSSRGEWIKDEFKTECPTKADARTIERAGWDAAKELNDAMELIHGRRRRAARGEK